MATNEKTDKPYVIKEEHNEVVKVSPDQANLNADEYHEVPGGVIVPQITHFGAVQYGGAKQEIPIMEVVEGENGSHTEPLGTINKQKDSEASSDSIAPSELVASVSQSPKGPPPKPRKLIKVTLDSPVFGKVVIPAVEILAGNGCTVLVTDSSDGFSFVPPVSDKPFTVDQAGKKMGNMFYCGQTFDRPSQKEQYLLLVHADKK